MYCKIKNVVTLHKKTSMIYYLIFILKTQREENKEDVKNATTPVDIQSGGGRV